MLANSSLLYKHSAIVAISVSEKKRLSLVLVLWYLWVAIWNGERGFVATWFWFFGFVICFLLMCCNFWIWFVALSLVCVQFIFGIWYLWTFGSLVCICERELFGCIWDLGLWECLNTNLYYPKFAIVKFVLPVDLTIAEPHNSWCFVSNFHLD